MTKGDLCSHPAKSRRLIGVGELMWCRACGAYCLFVWSDRRRRHSWTRWFLPVT
jgi:hypothetical protein